MKRSLKMCNAAAVLLGLAAASAAQPGDDGFETDPDLGWEAAWDDTDERAYSGRAGVLSGVYPHVYVKGGGMAVFPLGARAESDSFGAGAEDLEFRGDIGGGFFGAVGIRLGPGPRGDTPGVGVRIEAEYADRSYDPDGLYEEDDDFFDSDSILVRDLEGQIDVRTIMGNLLVDVTAGDYRGYIGFGVGVADLDLEINGVSESETSVAFQIPLGFEIQLVDHVWFDAGCRWLFVPDIDSQSDVSEFSVLTTELYIGLMLEF